jgi:hypothetical protein
MIRLASRDLDLRGGAEAAVVAKRGVPAWRGGQPE